MFIDTLRERRRKKEKSLFKRIIEEPFVFLYSAKHGGVVFFPFSFSPPEAIEVEVEMMLELILYCYFILYP